MLKPKMWRSRGEKEQRCRGEPEKRRDKDQKDYIT
jgi:hypothetical protein